MNNRDLALWVGVLAGPVIWLCSFEANFALAPWACTFQNKLALYLVSLAGLILTAGSGLLSWRQWDALGRTWATEGDGSLSRSRTMAISGVFLSAGFFLVILAQAIPEIILASCE